MRQMITRLDDALLERLKRRAKAERRSVNSLVIEVLQAAVAGDDHRSVVATRLDVEGARVVPLSSQGAPTRERALAVTANLGRAASNAVEEERAER